MTTTDAIKLIEKYYPSGELRDLLIIHSESVCKKAMETLRQSGLDADQSLVSAGALLHDIGIFLCHAPSIFCHGQQPYICHGVEGGKILRKEGYPELARFCERHTGAGLTAEDIINQNLPLPHIDLLPETIEEKAVCYADKFYSKSGNPMEEKSLDKVIKSMEKHGEESLKRFLDMHVLFKG
ncbi:MAG: HDIG domain-containing protein [Muribaculaceae bacterium]|nr:HDIG domain-containing protein [Muribaculaceae bacterium]